MNDLISRQDAIDLVKDVCDAIMSSCGSHYDPETRDEVYNDLLEVDAILKCNKEIRIALRNLSSAEPERHYCRECKWSQCHINLDKYGRSEMYWHCLNWDGETDEEGFCHEWERKTDEQTD